MRIVFIVGSYYPHYSATGKTIAKIAKKMDRNTDVVIVAEKNEAGLNSIDQIENQVIIRVCEKITDIRLSVEKKRSEGKPVRLLNFLLRGYSVLGRVFSRTAARTGLVKAYYQALCQLEPAADVIIPACIPIEGCIAAINYKSTNKRTIVIPYLIDLFAENARINYFSVIKRLKWNNNMMIERRILKESDGAFYIHNWSEHLAKHHRASLNKSWEIGLPLLDTLDKCKEVGKKSDGEKTGRNILYTGTLKKGYIDADYALRILENDSLSSNQFFFYAGGNGRSRIRHSKRTNIILKDWIGEEDIVRESLKARAMLSISENNGKNVSGKIFSYMSYGKPIIHFYYDDADVNLPYLMEYGNVLCIKANQYSDDTTAKKVSEFIETCQDVPLTISDETSLLGMNTPKSVSGRFVAHIDECMDVLYSAINRKE